MTCSPSLPEQIIDVSLFLPFKNLGLIIVDEEHDLSYKQHSGFQYSARDLMIVRANRNGVPVILGSATPSLETIHNTEKNRYIHFTHTNNTNNNNC